jgi:hypothetical protein
MDPHASPIPLLGMPSDVKHALLRAFMDAFWLAWNAVGWAFLTALVVFSLTYTLLWRRGKKQGLVSETEQQDCNEIAAVAGVASALIVQSRHFFWEQLGLGMFAVIPIVAVGYGLLVAWAKRRDRRLGRHRAGRSARRAHSPSPPRQPSPPSRRI